MGTPPPAQALSAEISLADLRNNEDAAWRQAHPLLWGAVIGVLTHRLGSAGEYDVEDLAAELLCEEIIPQVFTPRTESFQRVSSFEDLLRMTRSIAARRAIDAIRVRVRAPEDAVAEIPEYALAGGFGEFGGNAQDYTWAELMGAIQSVLRPPDFDLFHDRFALGLTTREVAKKHGMPHGTVLSRFATGLKRLAEHLNRAEKNVQP